MKATFRNPGLVLALLGHRCSKLGHEITNIYQYFNFPFCQVFTHDPNFPAIFCKPVKTPFPDTPDPLRRSIAMLPSVRGTFSAVEWQVRVFTGWVDIFREIKKATWDPRISHHLTISEGIWVVSTGAMALWKAMEIPQNWRRFIAPLSPSDG